jgi:hypothetical protein
VNLPLIVSRPFLLGLGPPFGAHERVLDFLVSHLLPPLYRAPSLTRGRVCVLHCASLTGQNCEGTVTVYYSHLRLPKPGGLSLLSKSKLFYDRHQSAGLPGVRPPAFFSMKIIFRQMASSGVLRRVALLRTDVSEELGASIIRVTRVGELERTLAVVNYG